jgi:hypothetical protein
MLVQILKEIRFFERVEPCGTQLCLGGVITNGFVTLNGSVLAISGLKTFDLKPTADDRGKEIFLLSSDIVPPTVMIVDDGIVDHDCCHFCHNGAPFL